MNFGGRPCDSVWKYFVKIEEGGKVTRAKCTNCCALISAKVCRLRTQFEKCSSKQSQADSSIFCPEVISTSDDPNIQPEKRICRKMQPKMNEFTINTNSQQKYALDEQIARLFYSCNLPFSLAENDVFEQTIAMLRPGYATPTRKRIACQLLDKVFDELTQATAYVLEGKNVTLIQDGWSDVHNSPVIAHSLHTSQKSFFLNSVDTGTNKKTATYCASLATKASEEVTNKFGCKIVAIVTDIRKADLLWLSPFAVKG